MFRSLSIMQNKMHYQSMHEFKPRLVISPRLNYFKFLEFHRVEEAIVEGERAAYEKLTSIRKCQQHGLKNFFQ
jgi:predicted acylesterase/phospholipase RssA